MVTFYNVINRFSSCNITDWKATRAGFINKLLRAKPKGASDATWFRWLVKWEYILSWRCRVRTWSTFVGTRVFFPTNLVGVGMCQGAGICCLLPPLQLTILLQSFSWKFQSGGRLIFDNVLSLNLFLVLFRFHIVSLERKLIRYTSLGV